MAPRFAAPPMLHHHTREDWVAYVVEGEVIFIFSDGEVRAPTGTTVFVPAGADFAWRNDADEPARYLAIHSPAGFDQFFVDVAEEVTGRGGAPTPEVMQQVVPRYGRSTGSRASPPACGARAARERQYVRLRYGRPRPECGFTAKRRS